ncbi:lysosome-associated membrane glycoprotein 3 [Rhinoderma darwinii]|uniref:lysosome-associated membrane glycoprotein 3 n=1 Tax=Rhinoderma darwinii TaxID=43563 RepID=UPI003F6749B9
MAGVTLIWSFLLFSGIFLVDTSAQTASTIILNEISGKQSPAQTNRKTHVPSNTTTHAPLNTTIHAPSNTTIHAPSNTTTHAPSNTTTHAPSNTTIPAPSNTTTHAPSNTTTHAPSNTTTHAPSNTTTQAPFNTTTHATTHITPTLPPKPSPPKIGNYTVKDKKGACIMAVMGLELQIDNEAKEEKDRKYFNIEPNQTNANGRCSDSKSNLLLEFPEGYINFTFVKESKTYYIEEVSVQFYVASSGRWIGTSGKLKLLPTDVGYSVKCKRTPTVKLGDKLELVLAEVKLQAFEIHNATFGKEEMCSYDRNFTAVAIAIVVIVIIVLAIVLYFIWHKRRSSGYQRI